MEIKNLKIEGKSFKAELKTIKPGKEFALEVTTVPPLEYGSNRGTIRFETNIKEAKQFTIAASAYVMAPVQVVPNRIMLPDKVLANPLKKYVTVLTYEDQPLDVSDIKISIKDVKLEVSKMNKGKHHRLTLTFPAGMEPSKLKDATLKLKTNHAEFKDFVVPIGSYQSLRK